MSEKDKGGFPERYFTKEGIKFCEVHLRDLIKIYQKASKYPYKIQGVFGVKKYAYTMEISSEEELFGRIKMLMTMLGVHEVDIPNYGKFTLRGAE